MFRDQGISNIKLGLGSVSVDYLWRKIMEFNGGHSQKTKVSNPEIMSS